MLIGLVLELGKEFLNQEEVSLRLFGSEVLTESQEELLFTQARTGIFKISEMVEQKEKQTAFLALLE